jgi:hypothetical protein
VATGLVYPCGEAGDVLQNHQLPVGYSKVTIEAVAKSKYSVVELDHQEDEDRKKLRENLGCQVFWCKRYITIGLDSESNNDEEDEDSEDSHQNREPSILSLLRTKTCKVDPSTRSTTQPSQNFQENIVIEEELPGVQLGRDSEEAPLVWQFLVRDDLVPPGEVLRLGLIMREVHNWYRVQVSVQFAARYTDRHFFREQKTHCGFSSSHCVNFTKVGAVHSYHELMHHVSLVSTPCVL